MDAHGDEAHDGAEYTWRRAGGDGREGVGAHDDVHSDAHDGARPECIGWNAERRRAGRAELGGFGAAVVAGTAGGAAESGLYLRRRRCQMGTFLAAAGTWEDVIGRQHALRDVDLAARGRCRQVRSPLMTLDDP